MGMDNALVDEYENLENQKKEIDLKVEEIKKKIIELAKEKDIDFILGTHKKCSIKEYEKIVYPEDKSQILELIKEKGLYDQFSSVNYLKLSPAIIKGEIDNEISNLTKREKAFRLSFKKI